MCVERDCRAEAGLVRAIGSEVTDITESELADACASVSRGYPDRDHRRMLLDLIETRGDKGKWFAAAKDSGFFDIAVECAASHGADPSTLVRAARDFCGKEPKFAATVALLALSSLLAGEGYDPSVWEVDAAVKHLLSASFSVSLCIRG